MTAETRGHTRKLLLLLGLSCSTIFSSPLLAQTVASLPPQIPGRIELPQAQIDDFAVSDVAGKAGEEIPLKIVPDPNGRADDLFSITGLPPQVRLSAGTPYDDFWVLRRKDLATLSLITPNGFARKIQIAVARVRSPNRPPAALTMNIVVSNETASGATRRAEESQPAYSRSKDETVQFAKAYEKFKHGDIAGARAMFECLATKGDAEAALAMAETYDPVVLARFYIKGLEPDKRKAADWYQKAQQLGISKLKTRLDAL